MQGQLHPEYAALQITYLHLPLHTKSIHTLEKSELHISRWYTSCSSVKTLLMHSCFYSYNIIDSRKQVEKLAFLDYFYWKDTLFPSYLSIFLSFIYVYIYKLTVWSWKASFFYRNCIKKYLFHTNMSEKSVFLNVYNAVYIRYI